MKLMSITFTNPPPIPSLRPGAVSTINCDDPHPSLRGWRVHVRGAMVLLVSPPGWTPGGTVDSNSSASRRIHEIPRSQCYLHWSGDDSDVETIATTKHTTQPLGDRGLLGQIEK